MGRRAHGTVSAGVGTSTAILDEDGQRDLRVRRRGVRGSGHDRGRVDGTSAHAGGGAAGVSGDAIDVDRAARAAQRRRRITAASAPRPTSTRKPRPPSAIDIVHPPLSIAATATQCWVASHVAPVAQSALVTHVVLQAPKFPSQTYGLQSNWTDESESQVPPNPEHTAMPWPLVAPVQRPGSHWTPAAAGTQLPRPSHVCWQLPAAPHCDLMSVP